MAQTVYKGVIYNTPDTPTPAPKFQSNLGASLGLAGAIPAPQQATPTAAPSSVPTAGVPAPKYNVNDPTFLNMSAPDRLNAFKADPNLAQQEIMRDKSVYGDKFNAGDMAGANAAHNWADQVRGVAGIPNTDPTYGNAPVPAPQPSGGFIQPQKAGGGPVAAQSATPTPAMPNPSVPAPQSMYGQLTPDQIKAEAQARIDAQRAALSQSVNATKAVLKNTYDYNNQLLQDSRALEDQTFKRNNSPFTGQTDYLTAQLLRNRGIQDTAAQRDYASAVAAADQKLNDFNALAPEQQQSIVDDLTRLERQYGLDAGQLTGVFNGAPTLAAQGQAAQYTGMYGGQPTLQAQNQAFEQQIAAAGLTGQYGGQTTLPAQMQIAGLTGNFGGQRTLQGQQADLASQQAIAGLTGQYNNAPTFAAQQAQQQNAIARAQALGVVDNPQDAAILGVPVGTTTREMQALMNDMAYKQAELGIRSQANQIAAARAGNQADVNAARANYYNAKSQPSQNVNKNDVEASYVGNIEQMTPDNRAAFFKNEKANIVKDLGVSGYNALYNQYFDQYGSPK